MSFIIFHQSQFFNIFFILISSRYHHLLIIQNLRRILIFLKFQRLKLSLQFLDQFLAEMTSLSKFALHLFMDFYVSFEGADMLDQLLVLKKQIFSLFGLILQFSSQLVVLKNSKPSLRVQLLLSKSE